MAVAHRVDLIAIGNAAASRETDKLAMELVKLLPDLKMSNRGVGSRRVGLFGLGLRIEELPGSTSPCAARCRSRAAADPLAELVVSPKRSASASISTISADRLALAHAVVEDCVNAVSANP
jgi:uncharacterized protein